MSDNNPTGTPIPIEESDPHEENAPYRLVILKRAFPDLARKAIVRNALKCSVLTIIDSHALKRGS